MVIEKWVRKQRQNRRKVRVDLIKKIDNDLRNEE